MLAGKTKQMIRKMIALRSLLGLVILLSFSNAWALTENPRLTLLDVAFYTFALSGVVFAAAIIAAYKAFTWLVYVLFSFLLLVNVAGIDGTLAYFISKSIGKNDFVTWVVPFLLTSSVAAYGYWMIALRLDETHRLARFKKIFLVLAMISAIFPLSCYFWLGKISLAVMWVPVNFLFFGMVLAQVLPPLSWPIEDIQLGRVIRLFPWVVGLFAVGTYLVHFTSDGFSQAALNDFNRLTVLLFAGFSLTIVIWQAFISAREKDDAERRAIEAAKNEAELQLTLLQAEKNYEQARSAVAQHRSHLATVSHDLKQPISALRMAIDQIQHSQPGTDKLSQAVDYIASLAHAYIEEGLDTQSAVEPNQESRADKEAVPTSMFAQALLQMFADDAKRQGSALSVRCSEDQVCVEPLVTLRAMSNLMGNAITHANATRILVGFRRQADRVVFQVHDDGCGMEASFLADALSPLHKGHNSNGHGLGLGIVKELCQANGMPFTIKSSLGKGTSAYISMKRQDNSV